MTVLCTGCHKGADRSGKEAGTPPHHTEETEYDLEDIRRAGELICATFSGPDTYYTQGETSRGLQYLLAADFARKQGLRLRMETVRDTADLLRALLQGYADVIAVELPDTWTADKTVVPCGAYAADNTGDADLRQWFVRKNSPQLADALRQWYTPALRSFYQQQEEQRTLSASLPHLRRKEPPIRNKQRGILSAYDRLFVRHSAGIGWDWRLLAAQCYQESGFDPDAVSPAGARGLMQIMPATASTMGINAERLFTPEDNVRTAVRYLDLLNTTFADITDSNERIQFVLAAYNGGAGHIRDAMALAKDAGRNARRWEEVAPFVLRLSDAAYYRSPLVKNGYMRGSETVDYVGRILQRWAVYRQTAQRGKSPRLASSHISAATPGRLQGERLT